MIEDGIMTYEPQIFSTPDGTEMVILPAADYARLKLLGLLAERDIPASVANDFADVEKWLPVSQLLITYVAGPYPDAAQTRMLQSWLEAGGKWLALHGTSPRKWVMYRRVDHYREARDRALAALERIGLDERSGVLVRQLSYGERRQLELALALYTRPKVLFLDEPCAGLSPQETVQVIDVIRWASERRGATVVVIEHDMSLVRKLADHVFVLHNGSLLAEGTVAEIQGNAAVKAIYVGAEK